VLDSRLCANKLILVEFYVGLYVGTLTFTLENNCWLNAAVHEYVTVGENVCGCREQR
jgi:hypothetical protein